MSKEEPASNGIFLFQSGFFRFHPQPSAFLLSHSLCTLLPESFSTSHSPCGKLQNGTRLFQSQSAAVTERRQKAAARPKSEPKLSFRMTQRELALIISSLARSGHRAHLKSYTGPAQGKRGNLLVGFISLFLASNAPCEALKAG